MQEEGEKKTKPKQITQKFFCIADQKKLALIKGF